MFRRCRINCIELVKSFQTNVVCDALTSPNDIMLGRMLTSGCHFFAWPGLSHTDCGEALMSMPKEMRTCHTVFGRPQTPIHLAADLDCPLPDEYRTSVEKAKNYASEQIERMCSLYTNYITKTKGNPIARQVILRSPNLKKVSIHIHTELEGAVFYNYQAVGKYFEGLHFLLPELDMAIYRNLGMLRCYGMSKPDGTCEIVRYDGLPELNIGGTGAASPAELLRMSFVVADVDVKDSKIKVLSEGVAAHTGGYHSGGSQAKINVSSVPELPVAMERLEGILDGLPMEYCHTYKKWITVGLMLKQLGNFAAAENPDAPGKCLGLWDSWSKKSLTKYKRNDCARRWPTLLRGGSRMDSWQAPYAYLQSRSSASIHATKPKATHQAKRVAPRAVTEGHQPKPTKAVPVGIAGFRNKAPGSFANPTPTVAGKQDLTKPTLNKKPISVRSRPGSD